MEPERSQDVAKTEPQTESRQSTDRIQTEPSSQILGGRHEPQALKSAARLRSCRRVKPGWVGWIHAVYPGGVHAEGHVQIHAVYLWRSLISYGGLFFEVPKKNMIVSALPIGFVQFGVSFWFVSIQGKSSHLMPPTFLK